MAGAGIVILILCIVFAAVVQSATNESGRDGGSILKPLVYIVSIPIVLGLFVLGSGTFLVGTNEVSRQAFKGYMNRKYELKFTHIITPQLTTLYKDPAGKKVLDLDIDPVGLCVVHNRYFNGHEDSQLSQVRFMDYPDRKVGYMREDELDILSFKTFCGQNSGRVVEKWSSLQVR